MGNRVPWLVEGFTLLLFTHQELMDVRLEPINWSMTYGPYELHNWQEYTSFCDQLCNGTAFYNEDADDYMEYKSSEVI